MTSRPLTSDLIDEAIARGARLEWESPSSSKWYPHQAKPIRRSGAMVTMQTDRGLATDNYILWRNVKVVD